VLTLITDHWTAVETPKPIKLDLFTKTGFTWKKNKKKPKPNKTHQIGVLRNSLFATLQTAPIQSSVLAKQILLASNYTERKTLVTEIPLHPTDFGTKNMKNSLFPADMTDDDLSVTTNKRLKHQPLTESVLLQSCPQNFLLKQCSHKDNLIKFHLNIWPTATGHWGQ